MRKFRKNKKKQIFEEELNDYEDEEISENSKSEQENSSKESEEYSDDDSEQILYENNEKKILKEENLNENKEIITSEDKEEFSEHLTKLRSSISELNLKTNSLITNLKSQKAEIKYGVSYLDAKNNMMLIYLINLVLYSLGKSKGDYNEQSVKNLIYLKTILEKSKVIDLKLKSQLDKLIKLSDKDDTEIKNSNLNENIDENNFKVNIYIINL